MTNPNTKQGLAHIFESKAEDIAPAEDINLTNDFEKAPSWFHRSADRNTEETFNSRFPARNLDAPLFVETPGPEAYDEFKRKLDDRFATAQKLYDPALQQRPTLPLSDIHGRRRLYQQEQRAQVISEPIERVPSRPLIKMFGLGALALLIGGGAGLAVADRAALQKQVVDTFDTLQASLSEYKIPALTIPKPSTETVIQKKSIAMASLDVNDVRGNLNSMIPLLLSAQVADGNAPVALKVMGLPPSSYLTKGIEMTEGTWLLKPADIAGVNLVVPQFDAPKFDVEIAAVEEKSGTLAAPVKAMTVEIANSQVPVAEAVQGDLSATIAPANAAPELSTQAAAVPVPLAGDAQSAALIVKGDSLLNSGDIVSARQFYLRASELGDSHGDYGVGRTYDPTIYAALNVQGLNPDPVKAASWYKRAKAAGLVAAGTALATLQASQ